MSAESARTDEASGHDDEHHAAASKRHEIRRQRAVNESISTLLSVIQYLNRLQDGDGLRIDQTFNKTEMETRTRILNCHEEDIMNASLITMKRLIETLLPPHRRKDVTSPNHDLDG